MHTKNWKRQIVFSLLISVFFSACSVREEVAPVPAEPTIILEETESQPSTEPQEPTPEQPSVIDDVYQDTDPAGQAVTFWHPYTGENEKALLEIIADFNATNPWNINVIPSIRGAMMIFSIKCLLS